MIAHVPERCNRSNENHPIRNVEVYTTFLSLSQTKIEELYQRKLLLTIIGSSVHLESKQNDSGAAYPCDRIPVNNQLW